MVNKVFPAARKKMPWAKKLRCQQDGAAAHTGKGNVEKLNIAGARTKKRRNSSRTAKITVFTQPAQSPDQHQRPRDLPVHVKALRQEAEA